MEHDVKSLCMKTNHQFSVYPSFGTVLLERRIGMKKIIVWVQAKIVLCFTYNHTHTFEEQAAIRSKCKTEYWEFSSKCYFWANMKQSVSGVTLLHTGRLQIELGPQSPTLLSVFNSQLATHN